MKKLYLQPQHGKATTLACITPTLGSNTVRRILSVLCVCCMVAALASSPAFAADVYVYCVSGKIEVDTRDAAQMKSARGSEPRTLGKFSNNIDANKLAKQFGGVGASCK